MMMDEIEVAAVWILHKRNAKRKVNRKMWVHPMNNARLGKGALHAVSLLFLSAYSLAHLFQNSGQF